VRPKASGAGLICRTDQYFRRQRLPYTCRIKTVTFDDLQRSLNVVSATENLFRMNVWKYHDLLDMVLLPINPHTYDRPYRPTFLISMIPGVLWTSVRNSSALTVGLCREVPL